MKLLVVLRSFCVYLYRPVSETIVICAVILSFFALVIWGVVTQIREREAMEGIWYCRELKMQISFTDPSNAFLMENEEKIRCRSELGATKFSMLLEVYCQEWEHPKYKHGKTLFLGEIRKYNEMSMAVYDRKTCKEYTFMRTDKIG